MHHSCTPTLSRRSFSNPNNGIGQKFTLALSFLICFHRELLEIPLEFSSIDHLALMSSLPVSISSPIGEVPNVFPFFLLFLLLFFSTLYFFKGSGHRFTVANNLGTLIVASPHHVQHLDDLDLLTMA
ncbi:hypothetical protein ES332_A10G142400v1 [Gossypium tomentosum]|uniref:Uncharacterized protein n=1 Tax=Gossypium tomentosum TaxID=34277 RepID=A0A5D2NQK2_GOSTO|nr:hypothetical protein ES332_A10G142400v1 [Gossypium tomentosum]